MPERDLPVFEKRRARVVRTSMGEARDGTRQSFLIYGLSRNYSTDSTHSRFFESSRELLNRRGLTQQKIFDRQVLET